MKKIFFFAVLIWITFAASAQLKLVYPQAKVNPGAASGLEYSWPEIDADGNDVDKQALVVIEYTGLNNAVAEQMQISAGDIIPNKIQSVKGPDGSIRTLVFLPVKTTVLSIAPPSSTGYNSVQATLPKLTDKTIYSLDLLLDKKVRISVEPLFDVEGVNIVLDDNEKQLSPAIFRNVSLGSHKLTFVMPDGQRKDHMIDVYEQMTEFNPVSDPALDMRTLHPLRIESTKSNSTVFINGEKVSDTTPYVAKLPAGGHTIKVVDNNDPASSEERTVKITLLQKSATEKFNPRRNKEFAVSAMVDGRKEPFTLYVNDKDSYEYTSDHRGGDRMNFPFNLPVGEKFSFKGTYQGREGSKTITVSEQMGSDLVLNIKKRRQFLWPWDREYESAPIGLTVGWVRKRYSIEDQDGQELYRGSIMFDDEEGGNGSWMNGVRVGASYAPTFYKGLGLHTGLYWECYVKKTDIYDEGDGYTSDYSKFQEHNLVLPVHLYWEAPFGRKIALAVHGGVSFEYCLSRKLSGYKFEYSGYEYELSYNMLKDKQEAFIMYPDRFGMSWDVALQMRLGPIVIGAELSMPLKKHTFEVDGYKYITKAYRQALTISYVFNGD